MWLEEAGTGDREAFEVVLAATEAFANAVEHPHGRRRQVVDVNGTITDGAVTVSVRDYGTWNGGRSRKREGGLGLVMIDELMDGLQVERLGEGTTVTMHRSLAPR